MRSNAQFCSKQHKKNAAGQRFRGRNPGYYKRYHGSPARLAWQEANRDEIRAKARSSERRRLATDPAYRERKRAWFAANRDKHIVYQANRRARKRSNPGSIGVTDGEWQSIKKQYGFRCVYCGLLTEDLTMDHVIPVTKGGRHAAANILPACKPCNSSKNALLLVQWKRRADGPPWNNPCGLGLIFVTPATGRRVEALASA